MDAFSSCFVLGNLAVEAKHYKKLSNKKLILLKMQQMNLLFLLECTFYANVKVPIEIILTRNSLKTLNSQTRVWEITS